jgi:hypothetical protein
MAEKTKDEMRREDLKKAAETTKEMIELAAQAYKVQPSLENASAFATLTQALVNLHLH